MLVVALTLAALLGAFSGARDGAAQASEPPRPPLEVSGDIEVFVKSAFGDPSVFSGTGYTAGHFDVRQYVSLSVTGQIAPGLSISGRLDNRKDGNLQLLELVLDGDIIDGKFGGVSFATVNPYVHYSSRLRGITAAAALPGIDVKVYAGRVQGIAAKKTFQGNTAREAITYVADATYAPSPAAGGSELEAAIEGMEYWELAAAFDEDFMDVWIRYVDCMEPGSERSLEHTLSLWNLGYLYDAGSGGAPDTEGVVSAGDGVDLADAQYTAVSGMNGPALALRVEVRSILRTHVQKWIADYNELNVLTGADRATYPFIVGSSSEAAFLEDLLVLHARVVAGPALDDAGSAVLDAPAGSYLRERYYDLGQTGVVPGSVAVKVRRDGKFFPVETEISLVHQVMYEEGVAEFEFPPSLFTVYDALRVEYRHSVTSGIFHLGVSIAVGSEKVYVNDVLLTRDRDYSIDYEYGVLTMFGSIGADDVVHVEYEYFRGPFGAYADYKSNFIGGTVEWRPSDKISLELAVAHYADDPDSAVDPEATPRMPNSHTILGLAADYTGERLTLSADIAASRDEFPFDDNQKPHAPNEVSSIMAAQDDTGRDYLMFTHMDGISAAPAGSGEFGTYGLGSGLGSPRVRGAAAAGGQWFFATDGGLSVLAPQPGQAGGAEGNPMDYVDNWTRLYEADGLPGNTLTAVTVTPWQVWVASADSGVGSAYLDDPHAWTIYRAPATGGGGLMSNAVAALAYDPVRDTVLAATARGVAALEGVDFEPSLVVPSVRAVVSGNECVGATGLRTFAAAADGVYARGDAGQWMLAVDDAAARGATALAVWDGALWIGTDSGLLRWDGSALAEVDGATGLAVTALAVGPGWKYGGEVLWAGTRARGDQLTVVEIAAIDAVTAHEGKTMSIPAEDSSSYVALSGADHTAAGLAVRADARYTLGQAALFAGYERVSPLFTRFGQTSREGTDAWRVGAQVPIGQWGSVVAEHSNTVAESAKYDTLRLAVADRVAASLNIGPRIDAAYTSTRYGDAGADEFEREERTVTVGASHSLFEGKLTLGGGYDYTVGSNALSPETSYVQTSVRADASLRVEGLSVTARFRRPVKTVAPDTSGARITGNQEVGLTALWAGNLGGTGLRATGQFVKRADIATERVLDDRRAELRATFPSVALAAGTATITPDARVKWEHVSPPTGQERYAIGVQGGVAGTIARMRGSVGASVTRTEYPSINKTTTDTEAHLTLGGAATATFSPQVDLRWRRTASERPDLGSVVTDSITGSLRGAWRPRPGLNNFATATYQYVSTASGGKHSFTLSDMVEAAINDRITATAEASVKGTERGRVLTGELKAGLRYRLTDIWSIGGTAGYITKARLAADADGGASAAHGFTAEVSLKASF